MNFADLDQDLIVWGVATGSADATAIRACRTKSDAQIDAASAPGRLVYHNPDTGWTDAATGDVIQQGSAA